MPGANYVVFENLRPPVAADSAGQSPLRSRKQSVFSHRSGSVQPAIARKQTDDGALALDVWDNRHHVSPSHFNAKNKSYF